MKRAGTPFTGFLYAGLMMTAGGPKLLEYNVRLGDPETQAILHTYPGDLAETLVSFVPPPAATTRSVCITMAAENYPETPRTGDIIHGIAEAEGTGATVFHAGTKMVGNDLVTSGGRVLGVTASAATLREAIDKAYTAVGKIHFRGMHYRTDIGHKGLARAKISATGT
jgi:phosphoribosylamine--glycine ligase